MEVASDISPETAAARADRGWKAEGSFRETDPGLQEDTLSGPRGHRAQGLLASFNRISILALPWGGYGPRNMAKT